MTGLPKTVVLTASEIREALDEVVTRMIDSVKECLAVTPPELAQDLLTRGIYLVGGGALLRGLPERLQMETKVPVLMSSQPLEAVADRLGGQRRQPQVLRRTVAGGSVLACGARCGCSSSVGMRGS